MTLPDTDDVFFVTGAPRSGTTFLANALQRHEQVFLTNETRVMTFLHRCITKVGADPWVLHAQRQPFLAHFTDSAADLVAEFYASLGAEYGMKWGDKHPHYLDSKTDPGLIGTIEAIFSKSRYINLVRDGRRVVASIVAKGWAPVDEAIDVWRRHVIAGERLHDLVGDRALTLRYEDFLDDSTDLDSAERAVRHIGLELTSNLEQFLIAQRTERSPFSKPTTNLSTHRTRPWHENLEPGDADRIESDLGEFLEKFGYA